MLESRLQNKELIIKPIALSGSDLHKFLEKLTGADLVYVDPSEIKRKNLRTIFPSENADYVVCHSIDSIGKLKKKKKRVGYYKRVNENKDLAEISEASASGAEFIIVDASDWKIIPLENLVATLQKSHTKIYANAKNSEEVRTLFSVLELGVDGVILSTNDLNEVEKSKSTLESSFVNLTSARVIEARDAGVGERVCVDTASMMAYGEGLLVGSMSKFLFLIHNESIGSSFTSPRPFRVNAGAVHCYTIIPDGTTKYLSELEAGVEILIVSDKGVSRSSTVGRSKIETRPLKLIRAESGGEIGSVIVQNAETIRLVSKDRKLIAATDVKIGDEIIVSIRPSTGRHFGMQVDEFIIEK